MDAQFTMHGRRHGYVEFAAGGHTFIYNKKQQDLHFGVGEKYGDSERSYVRAVLGGGKGSRLVLEATCGRAYGACRRPALPTFPL